MILLYSPYGGLYEVLPFNGRRLIAKAHLPPPRPYGTPVSSQVVAVTISAVLVLAGHGPLAVLVTDTRQCLMWPGFLPTA
jgi:hypothetical protein